MQLPKHVIPSVLVLMALVAIGVRTSLTGPTVNPYFEGPSAVHYRHAIMIAAGDDLSVRTTRSAFPDGYIPAAYGPIGFETAVGMTYRVARLISETDTRDYARLCVLLLAALLVVLLYGVSRELWDCQAGGLISAFFATAFVPLVTATAGRQFTHTLPGLMLICLHAWFLIRYRRREQLRYLYLAAPAAFLACAAYNAAPAWILFVCGAFAMLPGYARRERGVILGSHAAALLVAHLWLPWIASLRSAGDWPLATYLTTRLAHLAGKPADPTALSEYARHLWSIEHAPPGAYDILVFLLSVVFFAAAVALAFRSVMHRRALAITAALALIFTVAYLMDRGALLPAAVACAVVAGAAGRNLSGATRVRGPVLAVAALLCLVQLFFPSGKLNPINAVASTAGISPGDPVKLVRLSMSSTDRELIRFISQRTSVRNVILAPADVSALITTFSGRITVQLEGDKTRAGAQRRIELIRLYYGDEPAFYARCRELGVDYVLYDTRLLLDGSAYSLGYLAASTPGQESMVYAMHFRPQTLERFTLIYENDTYRFFRVTDRPEPVFLTDHPPVYHESVFTSLGSDPAAFSRLANELVLARNLAARESDRGNHARALSVLTWCLEKAPRFTDARIAAASTMMQMNRMEEARKVIEGVVAYAPDNARALYHAAYIYYQSERPDDARNYLKLFNSVATDPELIQRAKLLETILAQPVPVSRDTTGGGS